MSTPTQFSSLRAPRSVEIEEPDAQLPIDFTISPTPDTPQPLKIKEFKGEKTGTHIIGLKDGVSMHKVINELLVATGNDTKIGAKWESINTFSGTFGAESLKFLCNSSHVSCVEESGYVNTLAVQQNNAPWGLARLSTLGALQRNPPQPVNPPLAMDYIHRYAEQPGHGVDIYIVDHGVLQTHVELAPRAIWGTTMAPTPANGLPNIPANLGGDSFHDTDYTGHGTHVAGTAAGARWGVAKAANIIAVKITNDAGVAAVEHLIAGLEWVRARVVGTPAGQRRPSIVNLSMSVPSFLSVDKKAIELTNAGIHLVAAAGNEQDDAENSSPGRVPSVICVGASNIDNQLWNEPPIGPNDPPMGSNFGHAVTLFAPGDTVISADVLPAHRIDPANPGNIPVINPNANGMNTSISGKSGTSQAAPYVSGLLAYLISGGFGGVMGAQPTSPQVAKILLQQTLALRDVLQGVPAGTPNRLAYAQTPN